MSNRRRPRLPRRLKRAIRDYLRHGEQATEAVEIITKAADADASSRRAWAARPGR